ncbi:hypothetical protein VCHC42A1_1472, partial [Vibrio cholerae HC-42A1]
MCFHPSEIIFNR